MGFFTNFFISVIVILTFLATSCNDCIKGEGESVTKIIPLEPFNAIHLSGSNNITISQGLEQRVEIKAPENIIALLNNEVRNKTWEITFKECVQAGNIEINITTPAIEAITVTGSGDVKGLNSLNVEQMILSIAGSGNIDLMLNTPEISTSITGSGGVKLNGSATNHQVNIEGSGNIKAVDFTTVITKVKITGSGDASVNATEILEAQITGSGDVEYKDTGARIVSDITGSGDIVKN